MRCQLAGIIRSRAYAHTLTRSFLFVCNAYRAACGGCSDTHLFAIRTVPPLSRAGSQPTISRRVGPVSLALLPARGRRAGRIPDHRDGPKPSLPVIGTFGRSRDPSSALMNKKRKWTERGGRNRRFSPSTLGVYRGDRLAGWDGCRHDERSETRAFSYVGPNIVFGPVGTAGRLHGVLAALRSGCSSLLS